MRLSRTLWTLALGAAFLAAVPAPVPAQPSTATPSLYKRLGGYDAIAAVTDDFIGRLAADPKLQRFFVGLNDASKARVRQHVVDFLCNKTGGPCLYLGQDMKAAHTGLNITDDDWTLSVNHLKETFAKFNVGAKEQADLVNALSALKADIVGH